MKRMKKMKIIKKGLPEKQYEPDVYIHKCEYCECKFEFESKEILPFRVAASIYCPWCNELVYVDGAQKKEKENV
jgi:hypothetical protein